MEFSNEVELLDNERIDDLQLNGLRIIQKREGFCFGIDAVLLANFADVRKKDKVIDLGTGTGIIPILLSGKTQAASITGIEIQPDMAEMASRSVRLNGLEERVSIICMDLRKSVEYFGASKFNVVISNPPYINQGCGLVNPSDTKAISRHEIMCSLEDIINTASRLLVPGGQFAMVHRPYRLVDIMYHMRNYSLEPKYLRFVHPSAGKKPNLLLIKGIKGGRPELKMMDPLYIYDENGKYTRDIDLIYGRITVMELKINEDK
ncbi:MAG TPA: tRNA1(Val) (adenine(37)-N6)-methyltransferase [Clostridiaceae bacterium]|nr:tRNA1(Val) (adenine(37)-N6)-methyltransferase [Clostridiaceae bacterium]